MNAFIVVDGPNGSGKTTLINKLKQVKEYTTFSVPNDTKLAKMLRPICRGEGEWSNLDTIVRSQLFHAARNDEYSQIVKNKDGIFIADRWWTSTYVYQCELAGMSVDHLNNNIHPDEKIDMVIILDAPDDVLLDRIQNERKTNPKHSHDLWTNDKKLMKKLMGIYRVQLKAYLFQKNIKTETIFTDSLSADEVFAQVKIIIDHYFNG